MPVKPVFIRKAEKLSHGARIHVVGFANLQVRAVGLGTRLKPRTCASSAVVDYTDEIIMAVRIGGVDYQLEPLQLSQLASDHYGDTADAYDCRFEVTIPSDANVQYREPDQPTQNEVITLLPPAIN